MRKGGSRKKPTKLPREEKRAENSTSKVRLFKGRKPEKERDSKKKRPSGGGRGTFVAWRRQGGEEKKTVGETTDRTVKIGVWRAEEENLRKKTVVKRKKKPSALRLSRKEKDAHGDWQGKRSAVKCIAA